MVGSVGSVSPDISSIGKDGASSERNASRASVGLAVYSEES